MNKLIQSRNQLSVWLIAGALLFLTVSLSFVLWQFISSLEDNSTSLHKYQTGKQDPGANSSVNKGLDEQMQPVNKELGVSTHLKSTEVFDQANKLALDGDFALAKKLGLQSIALMEREMASGDKAAPDKESLSTRYSFVGSLCLKMKEDRAALQYLSKAIELNPKVPYNFNNRSAIYFHLNMGRAAHDDRVRAQKLETAQSPYERAMGRVLGSGLMSE